jgi:putative chitinase
MRAIIEYQRQKGLKPDGVIGKVTLGEIKKDCGITSLIELAHFVGQCHHETGGFRDSSENLNYSAEGLMKVFGKYFSTMEIATQYARKPQAIANRVYASRMGNGNEASGDGWKFRGRGAIQLTGKNNYAAFAKYINDPEVMTNPDIVATKYFFKSADFFFDTNKLWAIARQGVNDNVIKSLTRRINGGSNGLSERIKYTNRYYSIITK